MVDNPIELNRQAKKQEVEQYREEVVNEITNPSMKDIFIAGLAQTAASRMLAPAMRKFSKILGQQIQNEDIYKKAIGTTNVSQLLRNTFNLYYKDQTAGDEYQLSNIFQTLIKTKVKGKAGELQQQAISYQPMANINVQSFLTYASVQKMLDPNQKLSISNYLLGMGMGNAGYYGKEKAKEAYQKVDPEGFLKYEMAKTNLHRTIPFAINHIGTGIITQLFGAGSYIKGTLLEDADRITRSKKMMTIQQSMLSPKSIKLSYQRMLKQSGAEVAQNAIGLQAIQQFKHTFEDTFAGAELSHLKHNDIHNSFQRLAIKRTRTSGRTKSQEEQYLQLEYFLHNQDQNDPKIKSFIEEIHQRLPKETTPKQYQKAGLEQVTFRDIAEGKVNYTDIMGYVKSSDKIEEINVYNQRMRKIITELGKKGLDLDLQVGYGIYRKGQQIISLTPGHLSALKTAKYISENMVVPYLGFNPISTMQPSFLLEYNYFRPFVATFEADKKVATKEGMKEVQEIQESVQYRTRQNEIKRRAVSYKSGLGAIINDIVNRYQGTDIDKGTVLKALNSSVADDEFKIAEQNFIQIQSSLGIDNTDAKNMFNAMRFTNYILQDNVKPKTKTLKSFVTMVSETDFAIKKIQKQTGLDFSEDTIEQLTNLGKEFNAIRRTIKEQQKEQTITYIGKKPILTIGNRNIDISNYVYEQIVLNKNRLSGSIVETYAKQTGTMRLKAEDKINPNALRNLPFYQDFTEGETFFEEVHDMIISPYTYHKDLAEVQDTLHSKKQYGKIIQLKRAFQKRINSKTLSRTLGKGLQMQDYEQLIDQFRQYGKLGNYFKYMQETTEDANTKKQLYELQNLLEMNSFEKVVYSDINRNISSGIMQFTDEWLDEVVGKHGITRRDVLVTFGQFMHQLNEQITDELGNITKSFDNISKNISGSGQIIDLQNNFLQKNILSQINEQLKPFTDLYDNKRMASYFGDIIKHYPAYKLDDDMIRETQRGIISSQLYKQHIIETQVNKQGKTLYKSQQVGNLSFDTQVKQQLNAYTPEEVAKNVHNLISSKTVNQYYDELLTLFGFTYGGNLAKNHLYGIPKIRDVKKMLLDDIDESMLINSSEHVGRIENKYDIGIKDNRYITIGEIQGTSFKDLLKKIFPDVSKDQSEVGNVTQWSVLSHWVVQRTTSLIEELGLGRPNVYEQTNQWKEFGGVLQKISWIAQGFQAFGVLDQIVTTATGGTISPRRSQYSFANDVQIGAVSLQNIVGAGPYFRHLHETMPGYLAATGVMLGAAAGGVRGMFIFGGLGAMAEHLPHTKEFVLQSEGVSNVPVYRAQGWEFGREPYYGGAVKEYRPSLWYLNKKEWQYSPLLYGSKMEYQIFGQPYPTPLNLFGIIPAISNHYDKKLLMYRPYMRTGKPEGTFIPQLLGVPGISDNPVGFLANFAVRALMPTENLLDDYVAQLQKYHISIMQQQPTIEQVQQYIVSSQLQDQQLSIRRAVGFNNEQVSQQYQLLKSKGERMYADYLKNFEYSMYRIENLSEWFQEYTGFIGFAASMLNPFDSGNGLREITIQTSDFYRSPERMYYQQNLGNIFGLTEFYRRLNQSQRRLEYQINPLPNAYMTLNYPWLTDRFLQGDPYQKINYGEIRLPGPGYEQFRGSVDGYGPIDIYRILSNVSPYSSATDEQEKAVEQIQKNETTDPRLRYIIQQQKEERKAVQEGFKTREKTFTIELAKEKYTMEKYLGEGRFQTAEGEIVELRGFTTDIDAVAKRIFETQNVKIEEAYKIAEEEIAETEKQLKALEGQQVTLYVPEDEGLKYRYYDKNDIRTQAILPKLKYSKHMRTDDTSLDVRQNHSSNIINRAWENFQHMFGFVHEKFIPVRSQFEEYSRYYAYGQYRALWQKPISDILLPSQLNTLQLNPFEQSAHSQFVGYMLGANFQTKIFFAGINATVGAIGSILTPRSLILPDKERSREIEEETMFIKQQQGAKGFTDYKQLPSLKQMQKLLPMTERSMFSKLINQPKSDWDKILAVAPDYMKPMLQEVYEAKETFYTEGYQDTAIEESSIQYYSKEVYGDQLNRIDEDLIGNYDVIDPEQYRTLMQLNNVKNLSSMNIYETQIMSAMNGLSQVNSRQEYDYYSSQKYYIKNAMRTREQIYNNY